MRFFYCLIAVFITPLSSAFAQSYPAIFSLRSNSPVCAEQFFNITAAYSVPPSGTTLNFRWSGPNSFTSTAYAGITVPASAVSAGVYSVTMTFSGTNQGTVTASTTVSLGTSKPVAFVYDGSTLFPDRQICSPISLSFVAYSDQTYSGNFATYRWSGPNSFTSNEQRPVVSQGVAGLYIVEATYPNNCGIGRDTVQIYNTTLSVTARAYSTGANSQITNAFCPGSSTELWALTSSPPGSTVSYRWSGPNGFTSTAQSFTLANLSTSMAGIYSVTATFSGSCSGTAVSFQELFVGSPSVWYGSFQLGSDGTRSPTQLICQGSSFAVSALPMGPIGSYTFRWTGPNGFVSTSQSSTLTNATTAMSGLYSVTATSPEGCWGMTTFGVTISSPVVSVTSGTLDSNPLNNYTVFCTGSGFRLGASTNGLSATYRWMGPNGFTSTAQSLTLTNADPIMTGTYSVTAVFSGACVGTSTASSQIQVGKPSIQFYSRQVGGTTIEYEYCPDMSFQLYPVFNSSPTGFPNRSTITYQWGGPNGFNSSVKQPTIPTASTLASGTYSLTTTITGECSGTYVNNQVITVGKPRNYVSALPLSGISMANDTYCPGATVSIQSYNYPASATASYRWKGPNGFTSSAQNLTLTNVSQAMAGVYSLTTTYEGQCSGKRVGLANIIVNASKIPIGVSWANGGGGGVIPLCPGNYYQLKPRASTYYLDNILTLNTYEWTLPDGTTSTSPSLTINSANAANAGRYILKTTYGGVCEVATTYDTANITVGISPPRIWASNTLISSGRSTTLYAAKCIGSAIRWSDGQTGSTIIVSPVQTTTYTAVCVGYEGCLSPASTSLTIRVSDQPEVDLSLRLYVSNRAPTPGQTVTITLSIINSSAYDAHNVRVESRLPDLLSVISAGNMQVEGTVLSTTVGTIGANSTVDIPFQVATTAEGTVWLSAQIMATDNPDPDSWPASGTNDGQDDTGWVDLRTASPGSIVSISPEPNPGYLPTVSPANVFLPDELVDLSLNATVSNPAPTLNEIITVTLLLNNYDNRRLLSPEVTCLLPAGLVFVSGQNMVATGQQVSLTGGQYYRQWPQAFSFQAQVTGPITEAIKARISHCEWDDIDSDPTNGFDTGEDDTAHVNLRVR